MSPHYSVLNKEAVDGLNVKENGVYVDATLGYAGHASKILERCKKGFLYAFDNDEEAINYSKELLHQISDNFKLFEENFVNLKTVLSDMNVDKIDGIIFDLGFSSPQIDEKSRGFSFMADGALDMRMNKKQKLSAYEVVNEYDQNDLKDIFYRYGEEKMSGKIAALICKKREEKKINTTLELVEVIKSSVGANYFYKQHPERKIFQAIRIEVNKELEVLEKALPDAIKMLNKGGRICVITFHSLEDKIVKKVFKKYSEIDEKVKGLPDIPDKYKPLIRLVNTKPITPSDKENKENSRSHSAKLRIVERI